MATLMQHNKVRNATHNILAYRIYDEAKEAWLQVCALNLLQGCAMSMTRNSVFAC